MVADNQLHYNGLTLGVGTRWNVDRVEGIRSREVRVSEFDKPLAHGAFVVAEFSRARRIIIEGALLGEPAGLEGDADDFDRVFDARVTDLPFIFRMKGADARQIFSRPVRSFLDTDLAYSQGEGRFVVELIAGDPTIYGADNAAGDGVPVGGGSPSDGGGEKTITITPGESEGLDFGGVGDGLDFGGPGDGLDFGGGGSGTGLLTNDGRNRSYPFARITGPILTPRIRNLTLDAELRLNMRINAGEFVDIDFAARTILLNGTADRYEALHEGSEWWWLEAGDNTVAFSGSETTASTSLFMRWRDAF